MSPYPTPALGRQVLLEGLHVGKRVIIAASVFFLLLLGITCVFEDRILSRVPTPVIYPLSAMDNDSITHLRAMPGSQPRLALIFPGYSSNKIYDVFNTTAPQFEITITILRNNQSIRSVQCSGQTAHAEYMPDNAGANRTLGFVLPEADPLMKSLVPGLTYDLRIKIIKSLPKGTWLWLEILQNDADRSARSLASSDE
jgi:hypothetical protein